ncbi:MAG: DNA primase [Candidatus Pacebacteria bacterium]|nr:DNA primase [Candidatus Paceibacterota bacterium]
MRDRSTVDLIKDRLGVEEVISSYMKLEKAGKNFKGRCPFHNEKTASFFVSPERGSFYCFGCGAKGDIFSFVEQFEGLDFMGALKLLAERAGIPIVAENREKKSEREMLYSVMEAATIFYQSQLAGEAKEYIKKRGVTDETINEFRIGYVPEGWRHLHDALVKKGFSGADMEKAGLVKKKDVGNYYDRFRDRVMFPIMDSSGRVIAFSGRLLHEKEGEGKYINTPDTPLYDKSAVLYGIDKAKGEIRKKDYTILVEGQMDLIMSHQAGIKNTVAASGTALADDTISREQVTNNLGIVRRLSPNLLIAFDSDKAGHNAALRAAKIALNLGMDVKIADIEGGKDPADLVLANPENWKETLRHSKPIVEFVLDNILKEMGSSGVPSAGKTKLDPRKLPAAIREKVLPFIVEVSGSMERSHWIKMIHTKTGLSEDAIREDLKSVIEKKSAEVASESRVALATARDNATKPITPPRLDMVARKLFGILTSIKKKPEKSSIAADGYFEKIKEVTGDEYEKIMSGIEPFKDELVLEAEITYGEGRDIKKELDELMINFEEDILKDSLTVAMAGLAAAEREKNMEKSNVAGKLCHELSKKLEEVAKRRNE